MGYLDGSRDWRKAKCKIKRCCLTKEHITCADCAEYDNCAVIQGFLHHAGYKYTKYKQALEFIRCHDYAAFMQAAETWKNAYGRF